MTFKIAIDAGHGYFTAGKRTPDDEREWTFNDKVVRAFIAEMSKYEDVEIKRFDDPTGKTDVSLKSRTNGANSWGADIYISVHHNANTGKWGTWTGTETFIYTSASANSKKLASCIHPKFVAAYGLKDRGIKTGNLHIVREANMPSILLEGCYMDSSIDINKLRDDNVLMNAGIGIANGVSEYANLKKKLPIQEIKVEVSEGVEDKLFEPNNPTLKQAVEYVLYRMELEGDLTNKWRFKLNDGTLTESEAIGLLFNAIERGFVHNKYSNK